MAAVPRDLQAGFWIGESHVEPRQNRIVRGGAEARLEPRVMDVLVCLAERAGDVVSRDTINEQVWGQVVVTDQALTNCISELRHHLGDDRSAHRVIETIPKRGYRLVAAVRLAPDPAADSVREPMASATAAGLGRSWWIAAAVLLVTAGVGFAWWLRPGAAPAMTSVAVLRFENAAGDEDLDYLGLSLPDEIATLLTRSRGVAVRPFGYVDARDPLASARERDVDHLVSGRYYREDNGRLGFAIEALQVSQERVIWRTRISEPMGDLLAMRQRMAEGVQQGLLPALGVSAAAPVGTIPENAAAYQLYLRSLAIPQQPGTTQRAIEMLEQVVRDEPGFAPAWHALGLRYYDYGTWFVTRASTRKQSLAAHLRALELDPTLLGAARSVVTHQAETGDLEGAYRNARRLLRQFGPGADTHFSLSYVYRYGGLLDESQRHCELALDRDPRDPRLRSCGYAYLYAGKPARVLKFFQLDEGAYFVQWATVLYLLRLDDREQALRIVRQAAEEPTRRFMQPCLEGARGDSLDPVAEAFMEHWQRSGDPESAYALAPMLSYCGRDSDALRLLERGVDGGYCSYPALDLDPIWSRLRDGSEFRRIRVKAMACQERFRRMVAMHDSSNP